MSIKCDNFNQHKNIKLNQAAKPKCTGKAPCAGFKFCQASITLVENNPVKEILKNKSLVPRKYQRDIFNSIVEKGSTLVVLPTGLGKTLIAFMCIGHFIQKGIANRESNTMGNKSGLLDSASTTDGKHYKCVFLAPTKPLARQHYQRILADLDIPEDEVALVSGEVKPSERANMWKRKLAISTPQTLKNDIEAGRTSFDYALCIFDEAHRTVGKYAYTYLADKAREYGTVSLALTASPGSDLKKINPVVETLGTKNVQIRTDEDPDVAPYVQKTNIEYIKVELTADLMTAKKALDAIAQNYVKTLAKMGFPIGFRSKKALLDTRERISKSNSHLKYSALSYFTTLFNIAHATELLETQGVATFLAYMEKLKTREAESQGIRRITANKEIQGIVEFLKEQSEHPKLQKMMDILASRHGTKSIVFVQYRNQIQLIVGHLNARGFKSERFVGKKEGVTQKMQAETIDRFRRGDFDILVASSIGEEGLDIPSVDNVIFFEPVGSEIRSIQRRGRAGRAKVGNIYVLITKGTKDEGYFYASRAKEKRMKNIVHGMQTGAIKDGKWDKSRMWQKKGVEYAPIINTEGEAREEVIGSAAIEAKDEAGKKEAVEEKEALNIITEVEANITSENDGQPEKHANKRTSARKKEPQSRITDF